MVLGDAFLKLETIVWILNRISRSITWSLYTLKASYLVKWPISTWSFMCMVVSAYRLVKIWNSPQFPDEFRNGQFILHQAVNGWLTMHVFQIRLDFSQKVIIGEIGRRLGDRFRDHLRDVQKDDRNASKPVARHSPIILSNIWQSATFSYINVARRVAKPPPG